MKTIYLWCGSGYLLTPFEIEKNCDNEEELLELLAKKLIEDNERDFFLTEEEYHNIFGNEEEESYIYVDGTISGAAYPVYIRVENSKII